MCVNGHTISYNLGFDSHSHVRGSALGPCYLAAFDTRKTREQ